MTAKVRMILIPILLVAELVLVLSDPVFSREQCSPDSAEMG